ncbi:MAG: TonB-dependent receptor, partial [Novosphingobium sp.]|nr:TonB-dependent receptor [Novosphingobium sp.]
MRYNESTARHRKRLQLAAMLGATAMTAPFTTTAALAADEEDNTIIVTANKREQALEDVPMTVNFVAAETLAATGSNSVRDLVNVTTGFQLGNAGSIAQPAIRGISTINAGSFENNVAVFIDGIYQSVPAAVNIDLPNVANVQVLKGPQGTLYGRNATGGALLINTFDPGDTWIGNGEVTYGRFDDKRVGGYVAGPLSDKVGIAVSGYYRQTDGYYKRGSRTVVGETDGRTFGNTQGSIRAKLFFDLTENFRVKFGYAFTRSEDPRGVQFTVTENATTTDPRRTTVRGIAMHNYDPKIDFKQHEGSVGLELDTGIGTLKSFTAYSHATNRTEFDFNGTYANDSYSYSKTRDRMWQQSLEYTIDAIDNVDLLIGGTYFWIKSDFLVPNVFLQNLTGQDPLASDVPLGALSPLFERDFIRTKKAWAGYIDLTFHASDRLRINVGARYSDERQRIIGFQYGLGGSGGVTPLIRNAFGLPASLIGQQIISYDTLAYEAANNMRFKSSEDAFTPRASIIYELTPTTNIYAQYSRGFRAGEWNSSPPVTTQAGLRDWAPTKPEKVDAFEIGIKHVGRRLRAELAGFYYDYRDLQLSRTTQTPEGAALVTLSNARKAEIYGVEGSLDFEVMENFNIHAGFTWLHARYGNGVTFSGTGVNPAAAPGTLPNSDPLKTFRNVTLDQNLSGLRMPRSPDFTAYLGFDYRIPNGDGGIVIAANARYTTKYIPTNPSVWGGDTRTLAQRGDDPVDNVLRLAGTPYADRASEQRTMIPGFAQINASVTWSDPTDTYYVRAWGKNLTNKIYCYHY